LVQSRNCIGNSDAHVHAEEQTHWDKETRNAAEETLKTTEAARANRRHNSLTAEGEEYGKVMTVMIISKCLFLGLSMYQLYSPFISCICYVMMRNREDDL
jgi:hypothetical protein